MTDIDKDLREKRKQKIFDMYMACYTQDEIAEAVGLDRSGITRETESLVQKVFENQTHQTLVDFSDPDFETPLYNVWAFAKKTNEVSH